MQSLVAWKNPHGLIQMFAFFLFSYWFLVGQRFPLIPFICTPSMVLTFKSCIQVAESLSKYCILLHIPGGSTDAAHFSALCILLDDDKSYFPWELHFWAIAILKKRALYMIIWYWATRIIYIKNPSF